MQCLLDVTGLNPALRRPKQSWMHFLSAICYTKCLPFFFCDVTLGRQNWGVFLFFKWTSMEQICSRGACERLRSSVCLWLDPQWKSTYKRYLTMRDVCLIALESNKIDLPRVYWRNVLSICPWNPPKACMMLQKKLFFSTTLEHVQRRATKFILRTDLSYLERLVKLKLLPLEYIREILDLCFFFKCLKGYLDFNILP